MKIAVIGAGIAGLSSAIRLAIKGHEVHIFEANAYAGGKLSEIKVGDFRFDAGPSLFTMPHLVNELFELAGKDPKAYFDYTQLDIVCQYFWEDKTQLTAWANTEKYAKEVEEKFNIKGEKLKAALAQAKIKYEATHKIFLERSLHNPQTYISKDIWKVLAAIPNLNLFSSIHEVNEKLFDKHEKMVQLFDRYATYNGSNPYKAAGILTMIPHLEQGIGAFFPKGGMYAITQSLVKLAEELGINIHLNAKVEEILLKGNMAKGIKVQEKHLDFDRVVCNMDVNFAYERLLKTQKPNSLSKEEKSSSALIFYWGINRSFEQLDVHNIFFAKDYKAEFDNIFEAKTLGDDLTVYVHISSKVEKEDAPKNSENWFVMVNAPALAQGQDWHNLINKTRQNIIEKLSNILQVKLSAHIVGESILTPELIQSKTSSHLGALYGSSSNNRMAAFLRHANFSSKYKHLYFCGGSTHPGGGIPLCLLSGKIVADLLK